MLSILLSEIVVDAGINPRAAGVNEAHAEDIAAWLRASPTRNTPPAVVYRDPDTGDHRLSEGFHRRRGYELAGRTHLPCEVRDGDRTAALLNAVASNIGHGLKRTNEDKRLAVRLCLAAKGDWTERQVADHCGVDPDTVNTVRAIIAAETATADGDVELSESDNSQPAAKKTGRGSGKRGRKPKKADVAAAAARHLLKDHTRSDEAIATELDCKPDVVALARKSLADKGRIPKPAQKTKPPAQVEKEQPAPPDDTTDSPAAPESSPPPAGIVITAADERAELDRRKPPTDALGRVIPPGIRDTFLDPELGETIAELRSLHAALDARYQRVVRSLSRKPYPFCQFADATKYLADIVNPKAGLLPKVVDALAAGVPFAVCPCGGDNPKCPKCRLGSGAVPEWRANELNLTATEG